MPFTKIACSPTDAMVAVEGENIRSVTVGGQCPTTPAVRQLAAGRMTRPAEFADVGRARARPASSPRWPPPPAGVDAIRILSTGDAKSPGPWVIKRHIHTTPAAALAALVADLTFQQNRSSGTMATASCLLHQPVGYLAGRNLLGIALR
jgi:hypothetical protein